MARIARALRRHFDRWDRPSQIAFSTAFFLLVLATLNLVFGPQQTRQLTLVGFFGLMIITQIIFMWANRGLVTPFTQAQRLYLAEDFEVACDILEAARLTDKVTVNELALLGNAYRQRNMLDESETVFRQALVMNPKHHFSLYGFGRTLLITGRYAEAASMFQQALKVGDSPVARLNLGEALFRNSQSDEARIPLEIALAEVTEPYQKLMAQYLLFQLKVGPGPQKSMLSEGLEYCQAQVRRYQHTAHGQALMSDVRTMEIMFEEA